MSQDVHPRPTVSDVTDWWATGVSRISPNLIQYRGYPVQDLIGAISFVDAIWLLIRGDLPTAAQSRLLEAALISSADHGPQAPSIAVARMAATCGVGVNSVMASASNVLGDVHGGAGKACVALLAEMHSQVQSPEDRADVARSIVTSYRSRGEYLPGFGHRFHTRDPRRDPLIGLVEDAASTGDVSGEHLENMKALERAIADESNNSIPMNIDGATATIYAELGIEPELARGLFVLSRSVGILANAWEEMTSGRRIKGPLPPPLTAPYTGPLDRRLSDE